MRWSVRGKEETDRGKASTRQTLVTQTRNRHDNSYCFHGWSGAE